MENQRYSMISFVTVLWITLAYCAPAEFDSESVNSVEAITPIAIIAQSDNSSPDGSFDFR